jgi:sporulation protein YlmC with PRC-barrel domain
MPNDLTVCRLVDLLGLPVLAVDGSRLGLVNDLRLVPSDRVRGVFAELVVDGIVVGGHHAGSMLGYDRRGEQGPWLVRILVRALHRHAGYVPWSDVESIDPERREIRTTLRTLQDLAGPTGR